MNYNSMGLRDRESGEEAGFLEKSANQELITFPNTRQE